MTSIKKKSERAIEAIVMPGDLSQTVASLLDEWQQAEKLALYGMQPRNRVLFYGPSGNGKTALTKAIAADLGFPFHLVAYADVVSSLVGETNKNLGMWFNRANASPSILFFDECDSLCRTRSARSDSADQAMASAVNTLLVGLDRLDPRSVVFFATNFEESLDSAFRRRINLTLKMPAPEMPDLYRLHQVIQRANPLWPIGDFDVSTCGATSFAECEQMIRDHARRGILSPRFDPLKLTGRARSQWLRERLEERKAEATI